MAEYDFDYMDWEPALDLTGPPESEALPRQSCTFLVHRPLDSTIGEVTAEVSEAKSFTKVHLDNINNLAGEQQRPESRLDTISSQLDSFENPNDTADGIANSHLICPVRPCKRKGKPFGRQQELDRHSKKHGLGQWPCHAVNCKFRGSKTFYRSDKFEDHVKNAHHNVEFETLWQCPAAGFSCCLDHFKAPELINHFTQVHGHELRTFWQWIYVLSVDRPSKLGCFMKRCKYSGNYENLEKHFCMTGFFDGKIQPKLEGHGLRGLFRVLSGHLTLQQYYDQNIICPICPLEQLEEGVSIQTDGSERARRNLAYHVRAAHDWKDVAARSTAISRLGWYQDIAVLKLDFPELFKGCMICEDMNSQTGIDETKQDGNFSLSKNKTGLGNHLLSQHSRVQILNHWEDLRTSEPYRDRSDLFQVDLNGVRCGCSLCGFDGTRGSGPPWTNDDLEHFREHLARHHSIQDVILHLEDIRRQDMYDEHPEWVSKHFVVLIEGCPICGPDVDYSSWSLNNSRGLGALWTIYFHLSTSHNLESIITHQAQIKQLALFKDEWNNRVFATLCRAVERKERKEIEKRNQEENRIQDAEAGIV
ncbi:MAG: hypothetical protein M1814_002790 [Vezdaea aestivalis]|nr:MAG: hypothetical protein M1814_002790 [Vezdaea aestivalis]